MRFMRMRAHCVVFELVNGISWTYTALIMVFLLPKIEQFSLFLRVQISFSVFAISVLGGLLASSVHLRLTSLASSPPKTIMAHTEKNIFTLRNNLAVFLWHQKTIISAV